MKIFVSIATVALVSALAAQLYRFTPFTIDDAFITFSHAKNFVNGHGLVFSRGEAVEATSSFLWALLLVPFEAFLPQGSLVGSKVLGALSIAGVIFAGCKLIGVIVGGDRSATVLKLIYALVVITNSSFITWATYGMENGLMAFLLMTATWLFARERSENREIISAVFLIAVAMCRPEGFIFVTIFAAIQALRLFSSQDRQCSSRTLLWFGLLGGGILLYELFGILYYGHLLPNSATAKALPITWDLLVRGREYLLSGSGALFVTLFVVTSVLLLILMLPQRWRTQQPLGVVIALLWLCVAAQLSFSIVVGGDWMTNARFLSHVFPLLLMLMILTVWQVVASSTFLSARGVGRGIVMVAALGGIGGYIAKNVDLSFDSWKWQNDLQLAEERAVRGMADKLNQLDPTGSEVVACSDIGRIGYYYDGRVIDWAGLADEEIARFHLTVSEESASIILARAPKFLVLYSNKPTLDASTMEFGEALHSREFFHHPHFRSNYEQVAWLLFWDGRYQVLFQRKSESKTP